MCTYVAFSSPQFYSSQVLNRHTFRGLITHLYVCISLFLRSNCLWVGFLEMGRAPCCDKVGLKKGRWTAQEDKILMKYIETHGEGSWRSLPKNAGLLRCGKSCRLRWINYLRADLKRGNFTAEEEDTIIKLHSSLGNRWALIAGRLPGRTDNEIKNYWNSHLSKRIDSFRRPSNEALPLILVDTTKLRNGSKRKGRTARAAMKKNRINTISAKASNAAAVASAVKGAGNSVTDHGSNSGMLIASNPYQQQNMGMYNPSYESVGGGQELDTAAVNVSTSGDPMSEIKVLETDDILITFDEMIDEMDQEKEGWTESFAWAWDKEINPVATTTMREDTESGVANSNGESEDFNSSSSNNMSFNLDYPDWDWSNAIVSSAVGVDDIDIHSSNFTAISAVDVSSGMWADEGEEILSWLMEDVDGHERSGPGFTSMECEQQQEALAAWLLS